MGDPAARLLELSRWFSVTMNLNYFSKKTHKISIYTTFVLIVGISLYIPARSRWTLRENKTLLLPLRYGRNKDEILLKLI